MVFGIENLGATCFVSVMLQLFIACGATALAKQMGHTCTDQNCLACAMESELDCKKVNKDGAVKPSIIVRIVRALCRVKSHQQADPSEALSKMLEKIEKTEIKSDKIILSAVHGLFYIKMKNICTRTCGHDSTPTSEPSMSSILSITPKENVQAAIAGYFTRDIMDGDNKLDCDDCKCKVAGAIGDLITHLPSFFLLGFRNVQYQGNRRRGGAVKITVPMHIDETVDLRDFCAPELRERYSSIKGRVAYVCVHESTGNRRNAHSGHYLCYAEDEGQWHEFNDAKVTAVSKETVLKAQPYIMAYKIETVSVAHVAAPPMPRAPGLASDKKLPGTPTRLPSSPSGAASSPDRKQAAVIPCSPKSVSGAKSGSSEPSRAEKKRMRRSVDESEAPSGAGSLSTHPLLSPSPTPGKKVETTHARGWSVPLNPNAPVFKPQGKFLACQTELKIPVEAPTHAASTPHAAPSPPVSITSYSVINGLECTEWTDGRICFAHLPDTPPASRLRSIFEHSVTQRGGKRGRDEEEDEGASEGKKGRFQLDEGMDGAVLARTVVGDACKSPLPTLGNKRPTRDYDSDSDEGDEGSHKRGRRDY